MKFFREKIPAPMVNFGKRFVSWGIGWVKVPANRSRLMVGIFLLSLAFIGLTFYKSWDYLAQQHLTFDLPYLGLAVLAFGLGFFPTIAVWHNLLILLGVRLPFRTNLEIYCLSAFPRHVPGVALYVGSRSLMYQEKEIPAKPVILASALELLLLSLVGFLIAVVVFGVDSWQHPQGNIMQWLLIALVVVMGLTLVFFRLILRRLMKGEAVDRGLFRVNPRQQLITLFFMVISWMGGGLFLFFLVKTIYPIEWSALPLMIGVWSATGAMSMTLDAVTQGLGVRAITLGALLSTVIPGLIAIVVALGMQVIFTAAEFLWIVLLLAVFQTTTLRSLFHPGRRPQ